MNSILGMNGTYTRNRPQANARVLANLASVQTRYASLRSPINIFEQKVRMGSAFDLDCIRTDELHYVGALNPSYPLYLAFQLFLGYEGSFMIFTANSPASVPIHHVSPYAPEPK